jgi:hypothetical protein
MRNPSEPPSLAAIKTPISQEALDQLFREARTHSAWLPEPVPVELLREAYELARLGPTSANGSPARFVFLTRMVKNLKRIEKARFPVSQFSCTAGF